MKILSTEIVTNERGLKEAKIALDHLEIDYIGGAITKILNVTSWNMDDANQSARFDLYSQLSNFFTKIKGATDERNPISLDPEIVTQETPVEFQPNPADQNIEPETSF